MSNPTSSITSKIPKLRFPEFKQAWEQKKLEDFFIFKNGINASKEKYGIGYKFINVMDIINNSFITHDKIIGSVDVSAEEFDKNKVSYGDILFQRSSETREEVGQANVYLDRQKEATFGGFVIMGKKIGQYVPQFMSRLLSTPLVRADITSRSGGSTRYNIGQDSLKKVSVIIPSMVEQQKISDFFTVIDEWIENLQIQEKEIRQYKKGVANKIFSQKIRFKQKDGSEFDEWKNMSLSEVLRERKEFSEKGNGFEHISLTIKGVVPKSKRYNRDFLVGDDEQKKYKVTKLKDLCYNPANLKFGVISINNYGKGIFSPIYVTFEIVNQNIDFIGHCLVREEFIKNARRYEQGTVYERMAVGSSDFLKVKIQIPTRAEQDKIASFLNSIDELIKNKQKQIELAEQWKKGLLQQMFV